MLGDVGVDRIFSAVPPFRVPSVAVNAAPRAAPFNKRNEVEKVVCGRESVRERKMDRKAD